MKKFLTQEMPLHPEVGVKASKHRNHQFEVLSIVALSLVSVLAAYTIMGSANDVLEQSAHNGIAAYNS